MSSQQIQLSLVLPAYNEARRLPPYLSAVRQHLEAHYGARHEVIVVDDGSRDDLIEILEQHASGWPQLRWIRHPENRGKGAAVRTGILAAQGELLLFADADGATPIEEEARLAAAIRNGADLAVGSRLLAAPDVKRSRDRLRGLAGRAFAAVARGALGLGVRDTQCGFKMFRAEVGRRLFSMARESRYLFDLEILALAKRLGYATVEVPVRWKEIPGGHLRLGRDLFGVLRNLWRLRQRLKGEERERGREGEGERRALQTGNVEPGKEGDTPRG